MKSLAEKTFLRSGDRAALIDAPVGFSALAERPDDVEIATDLERPPPDWILA